MSFPCSPCRRGWRPIANTPTPRAAAAGAAAKADAPPCTVCGARAFGRAASGRASRPGTLPKCLSCGSLERHRIIRRLFEAIPADRLSAARALQFSPENIVQASTFRTFEVSVYGGHNSLDLMRIARPDRSYDWVLAYHEPEHVPDDGRAVSDIVYLFSRTMAPLADVATHCRSAGLDVLVGW